MNSVVLSARDISMRYGKRTILDHISIDIRAGEVTALLGPNGAGKSTLLKLLCGEIGSAHQISYFGVDKEQWHPNLCARHLGMLPQHSTLNFPFLAQEVVELGAIPLTISGKETREVAQHYMEQTGVLHLAHSLYPSLSGGEKQRLHLARVLTQLHQSGDKKILMLDEPTSALDLAHQHNTLQIARDIAKKHHAAVIVVLHDLNLASQYSDRMVLLHEGKLVCDGTPSQVLQSERIFSVYGYQALVTPHPTLKFPQVLPAV
ncbi:heme ABC transporter ATP-binding protein [Vibrio sp. CAU 1672]|uniref:heme ABC transporter ATP-binding protein n=1 Tax=Vibrio sp. CAU 1672 TaxID=3032594 RepID=UPI0023DA0084|nr:heme ABC transporter ATP-binding protein [Vibrio sp. CAU 1672]MDF2155148.1 heme ABC transporter ATP-binding protein [Vibrio sp. CAU 1672]